MTLVKTTLASAIEDAFKKQSAKTDKEDKQEDALKELSEDIATAIDDFVKSATVKVNPGIAVSAPGGAGATTAPGNGTLS